MLHEEHTGGSTEVSRSMIGAANTTTVILFAAAHEPLLARSGPTETSAIWPLSGAKRKSASGLPNRDL